RGEIARPVVAKLEADGDVAMDEVRTTGFDRHVDAVEIEPQRFARVEGVACAEQRVADAGADEGGEATPREDVDAQVRTASSDAHARVSDEELIEIEGEDLAEQTERLLELRDVDAVEGERVGARLHVGAERAPASCESELDEAADVAAQ